jgi:hypothetical protein
MSIDEARLALYMMLGKTASRTVQELPQVAPPEALALSDTVNLAELAPEEVRIATATAEPYRLFFVFERYLRAFVVEVLSKDGTQDWWPLVPKPIQDQVEELAGTEETKAWMSLGARDKVSLLTYPQLIAIIDANWKDYFEDLLRDKVLLQEARWIAHLRNAVCHMTRIPGEELERVRQVMRDWFRLIPP